MLRRLSVLLAVLLPVVAVSFPPASAEDPPVTVTITSDKATYDYESTARFAFKVSGAGSTQRILAVSIKYPGQPVKDFPPSNTYDETQRKSIAAVANATIIATVYNAQEPYEKVAQASKPLRVRLQLSTSAPTYQQTSGNYLVYSRGSSPKFRTYVTSYATPKRCLRSVVQKKTANRWTKVATGACRSVSSKGRSDWTWSGKHASGVKYRVITVFAGDAFNIRTTAKPLYFRFR